MSSDVEFLDLTDVLVLATVILGTDPPVRDMGLLEAAVARPKTSVFGEAAYPDICTMAAALLQSIVKNHPLVDGNKRLGWLATAVFLEINGVDVSAASNDAVYDLVIGVAAGSRTVNEIAEQLNGLTGTDIKPA